MSDGHQGPINDQPSTPAVMGSFISSCLRALSLKSAPAIRLMPSKRKEEQKGKISGVLGRLSDSLKLHFHLRQHQHYSETCGCWRGKMRDIEGRPEAGWEAQNSSHETIPVA